MERKPDISGHTMISTQPATSIGHTGMLETTINLLSHSTALPPMSIVLLYICLLQCLFHGTNLSTIMVMKENVGVAAHAVVIVAAVIIIVVIVVIGFGAAVLTVAPITVAGTIAVLHAVADGIIIGEHSF